MQSPRLTPRFRNRNSIPLSLSGDSLLVWIFMTSTIDQVATELARAHREADNATTLIKLFASDRQDEIHLLEVSTSAPTSGEVLPFKFAPDPANGVDYPSIVILLSPTEWQQVERGELELPQGWSLAKAVDL